MHIEPVELDNIPGPSLLDIIHDKAAGHLEAASSWSLGADGYLYASSYGSSLA